MTQFAKKVRDQHGLLDRDVADQLSQPCRAGITRRRKTSRKTSLGVLRVVELLKQCAPWPTVYGEVFPGYWKLDLADRFWRMSRAPASFGMRSGPIVVP